MKTLTQILISLLVIFPSCSQGPLEEVAIPESEVEVYQSKGLVALPKSGQTRVDFSPTQYLILELGPIVDGDLQKCDYQIVEWDTGKILIEKSSMIRAYEAGSDIYYEGNLIIDFVTHNLIRYEPTYAYSKASISEN